MEYKLIHLGFLALVAAILVGGAQLIKTFRKRHVKRKLTDKSTTPYADWPWPTMLNGNDLIDYQNYHKESYEEVTARYDGFGKDLFNLIRERMPDAFTHLKFYTGRYTDEKSEGRYDDCLAVYKKGDITLLITLSYWDAICLSNGKTFLEIQDWGQDYYEEALMKIAEMVELYISDR